MLPLLVVLMSGPVAEMVETTNSLELNLRVVEAFERGPVIFDVSVTNRGQKPLYVQEQGWRASYLSAPDSWNLQLRRQCAGIGTSRVTTLEPGKSLTDRHRLHLDFVSPFPAGRHPITVWWPSWSHRSDRDRDVRYAVIPKKTFEVTVTPATAENRKALANRLEAEFAALPQDIEFGCHGFGYGRDPNPFHALCEKVVFSPHKELIPLAFRLMDRSTPDRKFGNYLWRDLVSTVFLADAPTAHRIFVDRLLGAPPADLHEVFFLWRAPYETLADIGPGYLGRVLQLRFWLNPYLMPWLVPGEAIEELIRWTYDVAPLMLPDGELRRLIGAKDFWVRAWTYHSFAGRLDPKWRDAFLKEARQWAETAPVPNPPPELLDYSVRLLLRSLQSGRPSDHQLLEALAGGNKDNPVCKEARTLLAEPVRKPGDR